MCWTDGGTDWANLSLNIYFQLKPSDAAKIFLWLCSLVMTWSWEDKKGKRHYYSVQSVIDMEANRKNTNLNVSSEGKECNVNMKEMTHGCGFGMYREEACKLCYSTLQWYIFMCMQIYASKCFD